MSVSVFAGAKRHHREELDVGREGGGGSTGMVWAVVLNEGSGDSACDGIICCSLIVVSKRSSASASIALEISSIVCDIGAVPNAVSLSKHFADIHRLRVNTVP